MHQRLSRTRTELGNFLRSRREALCPSAVGLPGGGRRRTPGLRREEVAALAGVGLTWYTWLEQGREITVSSAFLDNVARVLKLDETERRHLFQLAHHRPPPALPKRTCEIPSFVRRLLDGLGDRPAHVLNLRWDVIGWNAASDALFDFEARSPQERNMLWMLFSDARLSERIIEWDLHAPKIVASFRRDFAVSPDDEDMMTLVDGLVVASPLFAELWRRQDVHGCCRGQRSFIVEGAGPMPYEHATFMLEEDRHLRLVIYQPASENGTTALSAELS